VVGLGVGFTSNFNSLISCNTKVLIFLFRTHTVFGQHILIFSMDI